MLLGTVKRIPRGKLGESLRQEPAQAERLADLDQHIEAKLAEMAELLQVADQQGFEIARQRVAENRGLREMDAIRDQISAIERLASTRREAMRDAVVISIRYALVSLLISTAFSCGIIAFGFRIVQREIAARRGLTESLQAADRNKNEFLAMLGHELRNPLAAVRNAIDVLDLLGPPSEPVEEMHGIIRRQTGVMGRLVDDLLDVSSHDARQDRIAPLPGRPSRAGRGQYRLPTLAASRTATALASSSTHRRSRSGCAAT